MAQGRTTSKPGYATQRRSSLRATTAGAGGRPQARKRQASSRRKRARRLVYLLLALGVVTAGIAVNYGPLLDLLHARADFARQTQALAAAKAEVQTVQNRVETLSSPSALEAEARQGLGYVRPGEQLFIVEGIDGTQASTTITAEPQEATDGNPEQGALERLLLRIRSFLTR